MTLLRQAATPGAGNRREQQFGRQKKKNKEKNGKLDLIAAHALFFEVT